MPPCTILVYASLYTMVGVHPAHPGYTYPMYTLRYTLWYTGFYTFGPEVEDGRGDFSRNPPFSPQNKLLRPRETLLIRQRNPPQKAPVHKGGEKYPTLPEVLSNLPRSPGPPFNPFHCWVFNPAQGPGFTHF